MIIGILKESPPEQRVVALPEAVKSLMGLQPESIYVEKGAGVAAFAADADYEAAGATVKDRSSIIQESDLLVSIQPLSEQEMALSKKEQVQIAVFQPLGRPDYVKSLLALPVTTFSLDLVPRTTRAQSMDILSSQATAAGYKAVLMAAHQSSRFFPMFTTAAGSIPPTKLLVLGAGVAGLQAIATARRLGAVVEAFDVRSAVKEEVQSLGAKFVEVEGAKEDAGAGGYAVEQSEDFKQKQQQAIHDHAIKSDVVICTAQIPGRQAPVLLPKETVEAMRPGSLIVDLAASTGGNCAVTENEKTIVHDGVTIMGYSNLPATLPADASKMLGKNLVNFLKLIIVDGQLNLNWEDDIVEGTCLTHDGAIKNERVQQEQA